MTRIAHLLNESVRIGVTGGIGNPGGAEDSESGYPKAAAIQWYAAEPARFVDGSPSDQREGASDFAEATGVFYLGDKWATLKHGSWIERTVSLNTLL